MKTNQNTKKRRSTISQIIQNSLLATFLMATKQCFWGQKVDNSNQKSTKRRKRRLV